MDWGEGMVVGVVDAADDGSSCDACGLTFVDGLSIDISLRAYDAPSPLHGVFTVCESCFEDVTSDLGVGAVAGTSFLVLVDVEEMFAP